ncbi:MAG: flagellar biosynthesis protein FlgA [Anaerolineae bacterium]|nr:flagellar biosynthesis protein FlgA [Anaerolineae bacterium]
MSLKDLLRENEQTSGAPLRVGLVGAGQMGTGLISQIEKMVGMRIVAVADVIPNRAKMAYQEASVDPSIVVQEENDPLKAGKLIEQGKRIASHSSELIVNIPEIDVLVECTGIPEVGAVVCHQAILAGKHIVNMNVETDCTVGFYLAKMAQTTGNVYTLTTGDEPGTLKELYDFADALGFEIVSVVKGKNNPLDPSANPDTLAARAKAVNASAKMLASFVDGTKTMVEMTSIGNGIGYVPDVRGAHGPQVALKDLAKVYVPKTDGGIMSQKYVVDYAVGDIAPGVFIIITTDQPKIIADLRYLKVNGHGNYWALYRPYHLCNLETPIAIARAYLYGEVTLNTLRPPVAETIAIAKRDLKTGEKIDYLGGYTVYGCIEKAKITQREGLVPLGISVGATVIKDIKKGEPLHYDEVELDENQTIFHLRKLQDKMVASSTH